MIVIAARRQRQILPKLFLNLRGTLICPLQRYERLLGNIVMMMCIKISVRVQAVEATLESGTTKLMHNMSSDLTALVNVHPNWYRISVCCR